MKINRLIGDKKFYKAVLTLVLPLVIQQGITNFVSLLDNVMVGGLSTEAISGVAIVNQLIFVFNLAIFGAHSGACIFGAQYAGVRDYDGVRYTFRFKLLLGMIISIAAILVLSLSGDSLIAMYLTETESGTASVAGTMREAQNYLAISLWGLIPFMISQGYATTLRENGETFRPMLASLFSIVVNLVLNYLLIYGKLGLPEMGVSGAALATVISRYVELLFLLIYSHKHTTRYPFMKDLYKSLRIPAPVMKQISITGSPLLLNELLWSIGIALINQAYSVRGLDVVAATNITTTVWNLFCVVMFSMGSAISIMVGQKLGSGDIDGAKEVDRKLIVLSLVLHVIIGAVIIIVAPYIPNIYNTEPQVRQLATQLLVVAGAVLPLHAFSHATYFTIRSGGRTFITFLFDSVFTWVVVLPLAYFLSNYTDWDIVYIYLAVQSADIIKIFIGFPMLKSGMWARNVIAKINNSQMDTDAEDEELTNK